MSEPVMSTPASADDDIVAPVGAEPIEPAAGAVRVAPRGGGRGWQFAGRYGLLIAFALVILIFSIAKPHIFPTWSNAKSILTLAAPSLIVAAGLTVVLVMQDFDLSFGAMIGLSGGAAVTMMVSGGVAWPVALIIALLAGAAAGLVSGYLIAYLGGSSFIITLAMGSGLTGLEYAITGQNIVYKGVPNGYGDIGSKSILGLSNQIWIAGVISVLIWVLLDRSEIGRYMYAIGGNPDAARLSGVRVRALRVAGFVVVGLTASVVGILLTSQGSSYVPDAGTSYLLPTFAGVFLGSAVFRPGEFNLPGTVVGVLFLGTISTGLTQVNLQTYVINLVQAAILITAVLVSRLGARAE